MRNLFVGLPDEISEELIEVLAEGNHVRIERIVSHGQSSPRGFWYDQGQAEWVLILEGEAQLLIEGDANPIHLRKGDHLTLPAHRKHRVEWTTPDQPTIWLAVFYG